MKSKKPQGRPRNPNKKIGKQVAFRPSLWEYLDSRPGSRATVIESWAKKDGYKEDN